MAQSDNIRHILPQLAQSNVPLLGGFTNEEGHAYSKSKGQAPHMIGNNESHGPFFHSEIRLYALKASQRPSQ